MKVALAPRRVRHTDFHTQLRRAKPPYYNNYKHDAGESESSILVFEMAMILRVLYGTLY